MSIRHRKFARLGLAASLIAGAAMISMAAPASSATFPGANCKIAYVRSSGNANDIHLMNADGSGKVNLTNLPQGSMVVSGPSWSPDGSKLVFVKSDFTTSEVVVMNADGSGQTTIDTLTGINASVSMPTWSPDGMKIVYADGDTGGLYSLNPDGTGKVLIVAGPGPERPQFLPDGRVAYRDSSGTLVWFFVNADGSGATTWSGFTGESVNFSPDGTRILYSEYLTTSTDMYVANLDGSGASVISTDTDGYEDEGQSWAPDGTKVVWTQEDVTTGNYELIVSNPDGSGATGISMEPTANFKSPAWGPVGAGAVCAVAPTPPTPVDPTAPKFTG